MKSFLIIIILIISSYAREYKVGFAQDTFANDWRMAQVNEVKKEVSKYPFLSLTVRDAQASVATQISDIEYFIQNNYDFIITSPINPSLTSLVLKKAIDKNIKVILIDRGIKSNNYTTFIRPDNIQIAQKAAKFMMEKMDGKGTILMLEGIKGATPTIKRAEGFENITNKYPDIKIIKKRANFLRADAIEVMESIYSKNIKFDAIYSHSDSMLSGVRSVMNSMKKDKSILMVGIDYIKETQDAIKNNEQTASFTYPTCGKEGVIAIVDLINKKDIPKDIIIQSKYINNDNVLSEEPIF
ncbi:MAG: substrate-binding domain-containing protein [Campylobacterota bacterium]|nr:substrate-binding domain-containing protein [Campylobacterota bacterium]